MADTAQTETVVAAEPVAGANATPEQIIASEILERLEANADAIREALEKADETERGDKKGAAFTSAKVAIDHLGLDADAFARWKPDSGDTIDRAIMVVLDTVNPNAGPAVHSLKKAAAWLAILASSKEVAAEARIGAGSEDKPQFNFVRTQTMPSANEADERMKGLTKREEARPRLDKLLKETPDKEEKAIYQTAIAAIDNVDRLRRLGNDLSATSMARSRWRKWLYVPLIAEHIDAFTAVNQGNKDVGDVWITALGKAQEAHSKLIGPARTKHGEDTTADAIKDAVKAKVWNEYLEPLTRLGRVINDNKAVDIEKLVDRFFALAAEVSKELGTDIANLAIIPEFAKHTYAGLPDVQKYLGQTPDKRKEAAKAAARREKEAAETVAQANVQAEANTAANTAREQRQAERASRQSTGQAPAQTTAPKRRAVVTPAADSKAERDALLAGMKPKA